MPGYPQNLGLNLIRMYGGSVGKALRARYAVVNGHRAGLTEVNDVLHHVDVVNLGHHRYTIERHED